jgi:hypothetical protein
MWRVSVIWSPMVNTGLSDVIGSWKIIEISSPRISRISPSDRPRRSRPSNRICPWAILAAGLASSRMMLSAETDLPQPDSPTRATTSPGLTS